MSAGNLIETLKGHDVDVTGALERFIGDVSLYEKCLRMFFDEEYIEQLRETIDKGDYEQAFCIAHTLKGVSANLGLTGVYLPVSTLVECLRAKNYEFLDEQYTDICSEYLRLKDLI